MGIGVSRLAVFLLGGLVVGFLSEGSRASAEAVPITDGDWRLCVEAADASASRFNIPSIFMQAILLVESGKAVGGVQVPWPWALNAEGEGYWHSTKTEALAHVEELIEHGATSFDVGCAQLNYRYHGQYFDSVAAMVEPKANLHHAARFVRELKDQTRCWGDAISRYHSRDTARGSRYLAAVRRALVRAVPGEKAEAIKFHQGLLNCSESRDLAGATQAVFEPQKEGRSDLENNRSASKLFNLLLQKNVP